MSLETLAVMLGLLTGLIGLFTTYSKVQSVVTRLEARDLEMKDAIRLLEVQTDNERDRIELLVNGLRERSEHVNTRLSQQYKDISGTLNDVESYLQKQTSYERRSR